MQRPLLSALSDPATPSSQTPLSLEQIRIASPCPASWETMQGDDRVRHCQECKLNVYNFAEMTRAEAEQLIARREGRLCVRYYRRKDGTVLTRDCPRGLQALARRVSRIVGAVLTAMMSVIPAIGQSSTTSPRPLQGAVVATQQPQLSLTVADSSGAVIQRAKVSLADTHGKTVFNGVTLADGSLMTTGLPAGSATLTVESPGFKSYKRKITIAKDSTKTLRIAMEVNVEVMVGVIVQTSTTDHDSSERKTTIGGDLLHNLPLR